MIFRNGDLRAAFRGLVALVPLLALASCASTKESPVAVAGARVLMVTGKVVALPVVAVGELLVPGEPDSFGNRVVEVIDYVPPTSGNVSGPPVGPGSTSERQ